MISGLLSTLASITSVDIKILHSVDLHVIYINYLLPVPENSNHTGRILFGTLYWGAPEGDVRWKTKTQEEKKDWLKIERQNETIKHEVIVKLPHDQKGTRYGDYGSLRF